MVHACSPSAWEVEAGESGVQGLPQLQSEFQDSLCCMTCISKQKKNKKIKKFEMTMVRPSMSGTKT